MKVSIILPMAPRGKQRPRHVSRGKFSTVYTPKETRDWTTEARRHLDNLWYLKPYEKGVPVGIKITAVFKRPQRLLRARDPEGRIFKVNKPDADNVSKLVMDSLNGIAWHDDAQVCDEQTIKYYAAKGEIPHVEICIWELHIV